MRKPPADKSIVDHDRFKRDPATVLASLPRDIPPDVLERFRLMDAAIKAHESNMARLESEMLQAAVKLGAYRAAVAALTSRAFQSELVAERRKLHSKSLSPQQVAAAAARWAERRAEVEAPPRKAGPEPRKGA